MRVSRKSIDFAGLAAARKRPLVMGILNVTPDSFSDGGRFSGHNEAADRAAEMAREGADIIDVGGESTRPGAREVGADEEIARIVPVIRSISSSVGVAVSVDTRKARVAEAAIEAGAAIINDVSGLRYDPQMLDVAARRGAALVIMHSRGTPADMQRKARYKDLIADVLRDLRASVNAAVRSGVARRSIAVDPGIGFAKTAEQSIALISGLGRLRSLGCAICAGVSRKSFIGMITGDPDPASRLAGTIAANTAAIMGGADIIRVHDVKEACETAAVAAAIRKAL